MDKDMNEYGQLIAHIKTSTTYYWAGGGIVYDSQLEEEYQETLTKARGFLQFCTSS